MIILRSDRHFYWVNIRLFEYNILSVQTSATWNFLRKLYFYNKKKLVFYEGTKMFEGNTGDQCHLLVFLCYFCPGIVMVIAVTGKPVQQMFCANAVQLLFFPRKDTWRPRDHNYPVRMPFDCRSDIPLWVFWRLWLGTLYSNCSVRMPCNCCSSWARTPGGLGTTIILCVCRLIVVQI